MKRGDMVWCLDDDGTLCGARLGEGSGRGSLREWSVVTDTGWVTRRTSAHIEAAIALRAASDAVAQARDAVVEAADLWEQGAGYRVGDLERAVHALRVAVGEEAVARARLEALR